MNFEKFKDDVISVITNEELKGKVLHGTPIYSLGFDDREKIDSGGLDLLSDDLHQYTEAIRRVTSMKGYDYAALAVFSMAANLGKIEDPEEFKAELDKLSPQKMMEALDEKGLLLKSISIRFESKQFPDENGMLTFIMNKDKDIEENIFILDNEVDGDQQLAPFGGHFFDYD